MRVELQAELLERRRCGDESWARHRRVTARLAAGGIRGGRNRVLLAPVASATAP